jgi:hypothetical protein
MVSDFKRVLKYNSLEYLISIRRERRPLGGEGVRDCGGCACADATTTVKRTTNRCL